MSDLELPDGFDDASADVQQALLESYRSEQLVSAIRDELGTTGRDSPALSKSNKAAVLIALRNAGSDD